MARRAASPGKHTGFLTPEAKARRDLVEAQNVDNTVMRRLPGDEVLDRDGRVWVVQEQRKERGLSEQQYVWSVRW